LQSFELLYAADEIHIDRIQSLAPLLYNTFAYHPHVPHILGSAVASFFIDDYHGGESASMLSRIPSNTAQAFRGPSACSGFT
jgi:hypothetical protein